MRKIARPRRARRAMLRAGALLALPLTGCGGDEFANDPRPTETVTLSAVVAPQRVTVSPARFGAGRVTLLVSNQTSTSQRVRLRSQGLEVGDAVLDQTTGPIAPGGTAPLTAVLAAGTYSVSASSARIEPARIVAGAERPSPQDGLLAP
jgi:hypothetical protein